MAPLVRMLVLPDRQQRSAALRSSPQTAVAAVQQWHREPQFFTLEAVEERTFLPVEMQTSVATTEPMGFAHRVLPQSPVQAARHITAAQAVLRMATELAKPARVTVLAAAAQPRATTQRAVPVVLALME